MTNATPTNHAQRGISIRHRGVVRAFAVAILTLLIVPVLTIARSTPAQAAPEAYGETATLGTGSTWLGNYWLDGVLVYCAAQSNRPGADSNPSNLFNSTVWIDGSTGGSWTGQYSGTAPGIVTPVTNTPAVQFGADLNQNNSGTVTQSGVTLTGANLNRIGYVLARWGQTTDSTQAMRVRLLILEKFRVMYNGVYTGYLNTPSGAELDNRNAVNSMWNAAIANAGPYSTAPSLAVNVNGDGDGGTVSGIAFYSAAGNIQGGYSYTATITSGNALWDSNNASSFTGTTGASPASLPFHVAPGQSGFVNVEVTFANVPDWRVGVRTSQVSNGQDVMYGRTMNLIMDADAIEPVQDQFEIQIATQTSQAVATAGTELTDTLLVSSAGDVWEPPGHEITVTSTLYGPFDSAPVEQATVPVGAPVVGSVTTVVNGPGSYTTPPVTLPGPGYYVWHETSPADEFVFAWSGRFGVASETTLVPWDPSVTTTISSGRFAAGDTVSDGVVVSDAQPGSTLTIDGTLYYMPGVDAPAQQGTVPAEAVVAGTSTVDIVIDSTGSGTGTLPGVTIPLNASPGWYTWVVETVASSTNANYTSEFGIPEETGVLPWSPSISTVIDSQTLAPGVSVGDSFTITGGRPGEEVTVTGQLYRDAGSSAPSQQSTIPGDAVLVGASSATVTIGSDGTVTGSLPAVTHGDTPGYYTWVVSSPASLTMNTYTSDYGIPAETGMLPWAPSITTTISSPTLEVGEDVGDSFTITGGRPGEDVTVTGELYRDAGHEFPAQQASVPADATLVGSSSVTVTIDSDGTASGTLPSVPHEDVSGYYTWVVSTPASTTMGAYRSDYGIFEETGLLAWSPLASTVASSSWTMSPLEGVTSLSQVSGTMEIVDEVTIEGLPDGYGLLPDETEPVTVDLYFVHHAEIAGDLSLLPDMCTPENLLYSTSVPVANGIHTTDPYTVPLVLSDAYDGFYMFVHSHPGSERIEPFAGVCAEASETLYLTPSAIITTLVLTGVDDRTRNIGFAAVALMTAGAALFFVRRSVRLEPAHVSAFGYRRTRQIERGVTS